MYHEQIALKIVGAEQEEYIKEEQRSLKRELLRAQEEVKRIQSVPLVIGQFLEMVDGNSGIVGSTTGVPEPLTYAERPGYHHAPHLVTIALTCLQCHCVVLSRHCCLIVPSGRRSEVTYSYLMICITALP